MAYGVSPELLFSGDLRLSLAQSQNTADEDTLKELLSNDSLITLKGNKLEYSKEFMERQKLYLHSIKQARAPFSGAHAGACAVLCGAGWSQNPQLIEEAYKAGAVIIAIGSGAHDNPWAQYWIGSSSPVDYPKEALIKANTVRFTPAEYSREQHFASSGMAFRGPQVHAYPGVVLIPKDEVDFRDIHEDIPDNSFYMGIYLAARLGIADLILTGVDMGAKPTDANKWYGSKMTINIDLRREKEELYRSIITDFDDRLLDKLAVYYGMRVYADQQSPFRAVNVMTSAKLLASLKRRTSRGVANHSLVRTKVTMADREELAEIALEASKHKIDPRYIMDHTRGLLEAVPEVFDTDMLKQNLAKYEEAKKTPGGCKSCDQGRYGQHTFRLFVSAVQGDYAQKTLDYWSTHMSEKTCYHHGQDYSFPTWHAETAARYNELRKRT